MSDRASLWRLLKELDKATRTEQAIIIEEAILKLFDTVRDEMYADTEKLRAELNEEQAKFTQLRHAADELMGQVYSWANGHVGVVVSVGLSNAYYKMSLIPLKDNENV